MVNNQLSRRTFLQLSGLISAGAVLAACAPTTLPTTSGGEAAPAAEPATLVFWTPQHFIVEQNEYFTESLKMSAEANAFAVEVQLFPWGEIMIGAFLMSIPVLILYVLAQRFVVTGLTAGAVKG